MIALVIYLLIHSHIKYNKKKKEEQEDVTMQIVLRSDDEAEVWSAVLGPAAFRLSLVAASRGYSLVGVPGFSSQWFPLWQSTGSRRVGFSSCSTCA